MRYLITGGCGFIGTNFADRLLERGDSVTVLDNMSRKGTETNLQYLQDKHPRMEFTQADIRSDQKILNDAVKEVDVVYHLASQVAVTTSVSNPREDFQINAFGTLNILEAIRAIKKQPILIYASTNKVYGGMEDIVIVKRGNRYVYRDLPEGIKEDRLLDFHSPYGCSKGAADQYVRDYARIYGLRTVVMRQSCIYGPHQFGVDDQGCVAWFTIAALLNKDITIYGDGMQVRDVLPIDDLFAAWDIATNQIKTTSGEIFNVGGGQTNTLSLLQLIDFLEKFFNKKVKRHFADWRPGDQPVYVSDISKITTELKWEPKISVEKGVKLLYQWITHNHAVLEK